MKGSYQKIPFHSTIEKTFSKPCICRMLLPSWCPPCAQSLGWSPLPPSLDVIYLRPHMCVKFGDDPINNLDFSFIGGVILNDWLYFSEFWKCSTTVVVIFNCEEVYHRFRRYLFCSFSALGESANRKICLLTSNKGSKFYEKSHKFGIIL